MKVGFYLAYAPHKKDFSLKQEGLGRYMASLLKAFCENDDSITVACPKWSVDAIYELLEENNINKEKIEFVYPKSIPIMLDIYLRIDEKKKKKKKVHRGRINKAAINALNHIIDGFLSARNALVFILMICLFVLLSLLLLPVAIFLGLCFALAAFVLKIISFFDKKKYSIMQIFKNNRFTRNMYLYLRTEYSGEKLIEFFRRGSAKEIIRNINAMIEKPDLWYCPMAFWSEFNTIKGTKVTCAPDLVTEEFVYGFSTYSVGKATDDVRKTIEGGKYFITYCNYLKQTLLVDKFGKKEKNIISIPHAVNDSAKYIDVSECFHRDGFPYDVSMRFAKLIIKSALEKALNVQSYLFDSESCFCLEDVSYIFYASQVRSNKNILNLVKAYEYLLKEKGISVKLFLTANVNNNKQLYDYIYQNNLQYDVLFFNSLTNQQLAAFYKAAELVVNPTFYEGGFPFTFGEGMSVGTPSVMSKIPQITEFLNEQEFAEFLFDPYDVKDMAEKIFYGLLHKEELFLKQKKVFDVMNVRTWEDVGREYVEAFSYFIEMEREKKVL